VLRESRQVQVVAKMVPSRSFVALLPSRFFHRVSLLASIAFRGFNVER
jgi:hypothetical protein